MRMCKARKIKQHIPDNGEDHSNGSAWLGGGGSATSFPASSKTEQMSHQREMWHTSTDVISPLIFGSASLPRCLAYDRNTIFSIHEIIISML